MSGLRLMFRGIWVGSEPSAVRLELGFRVSEMWVRLTLRRVHRLVLKVRCNAG